MPLRWLTCRLSLAAVVLAAAGCSSLPPAPQQPHEAALAPAADAPLARLAGAALAELPPGESGFQLLFTGEAAFNARIALVRRATGSIDLQVYQFAADATGLGLLRELHDAAARGVRVRLLIDDLHAGGQEAMLAGLAAHPNAQVRLFNPLPARAGTPLQRLAASLHDFGRVNRRMHNKLFVADGSFAVFGGRNVADCYFMNDPQANFLDLDVLAAGAVVAELAAVFDRFWNSALAYPVDALPAAPAAVAGVGPSEALPAPVPPPDDAASRAAAFDTAVRSGTVRLGDRSHDWFGRPGILRQFATGRIVLDGGSAQVWADAPEKVRGGAAAGPTVAARTLALLADAQHTALILSPYFIPGADGVQAMRRLVQERGVTVTLLTNSFGATDEPLAYAGYGRYRLALLRAGVRIQELSPTLARDSGRIAYFGDNTIGRLHTKAMAIDRRWLFVGSLNLDPRSAFSNTEMGVVIDSPKLAQQLAGVYRHAAAGGAFTLRLADDGTRIEWVATDWQGHETVHADEPHDDAWLRLKLRLLQPWVPEDLL